MLAHSHKSTNLIDEMGVNPRQRMAHASDKTTQIYTDSHDVEWHEVPAISVAIYPISSAVQTTVFYHLFTTLLPPPRTLLSTNAE